MPNEPNLGILILGGGGHARVIIDSLANSTGLPSGSIILDPEPALWGTEIQGVPILGGDDLIPGLMDDGVTRFVIGLGGTQDNKPRKKVFELALSYGLEPVTVCHASSVRSFHAVIGSGTVLLPQSVVNAGALVGDNVILNTSAIVEHDCIVRDHVHMATGSRLCSTVTVGEGAHIGAGATVRQMITIGEGAVIGMGSVVVKDVPAGVTVVGVPASEICRANELDGS